MVAESDIQIHFYNVKETTHFAAKFLRALQKVFYPKSVRIYHNLEKSPKYLSTGAFSQGANSRDWCST